MQQIWRILHGRTVRDLGRVQNLPADQRQSMRRISRNTRERRERELIDHTVKTESGIEVYESKIAEYLKKRKYITFPHWKKQ